MPVLSTSARPLNSLKSLTSFGISRGTTSGPTALVKTLSISRLWHRLYEKWKIVAEDTKTCRAQTRSTAAATANPKAAMGLLVSLAMTLTCTAVLVLVAPVSVDAPVEAPSVVLPIIPVSVAVAPLVSVGTPVITALPVPIELVISQPDPLVDFGIDMVAWVVPKRGLVATVPVGPVHWPVLDGTASDPDPMGMIFSSQSSACARCRFASSWS